MSPTNSLPRDGVDLVRQALARAHSLLEEALLIVDEHAGAPELGARIQEVMDALKSRAQQD